MTTLADDLTQHLAAGIEGNQDLIDILGTITGLELTPEVTAALLVGIAGADLPSPEVPIAIVQAAESHAGAGMLPELLATYNYYFDSINYFGADIGAHTLISKNLSLFANMSWISYDHRQLFDLLGGPPGEDEVGLNAPSFKLKLGGTYRFNSGLSVSTSIRCTDGFEMISRPYVGDVEGYCLTDAGIGYDIGGGLRADLSVTNLTNNERYEFIGAPKIGRVGTVRLLYSTGW